MSPTSIDYTCYGVKSLQINKKIRKIVFVSNQRNSGNNDITTFSKAISLHWEIYDEEGNHISSFNQNADSIDDDMIHLFDGFYSVTREKILSLEPIEIDFANAKEVSLGVQ